MSNNSFTARNFDLPVDVTRYATVTADRPAGSVSSRYRFIPTTEPLKILADYGWFPVQVREARTLSDVKKGFQKHVVRLSNKRFSDGLEVGGTIPQILLTNDHSGGAAFEFLCGLFEKVCSNGLCVARPETERVRVTHRGYDTGDVEAGIKRIMAEMPHILAMSETFKGIKLERGHELAFARSALELRWDGQAYSLQPEELLRRRHYQQREANLWNTYNAVQENLIRGGMYQRNTLGRLSRVRAISSVREDLRINKELWRLTEAYAYSLTPDAMTALPE